MDSGSMGDQAGGLVRRAGRPGELVLEGVDRAVSSRWVIAQERASSVSGSIEERVATLTRTYCRELASVGAAAGGTAAVPGAGLVTLVGTTAADFSWFTIRSADLILAIAAVHGHTQASVEERRMWVLSVLAFGDSASTGITKLSQETAKGLGKKAVERIPTDALRQVNRMIGRTVVTKYGTKRGVVALGRALPFGFGAAIGGGSNYVLTRAIARQADKLFADLGGPPTPPAVGESSI